MLTGRRVRNRSPRPFFAPAAGLLVLLACGAEPSTPPAPFRDLTPALRARVDRLAGQQPTPTPTATRTQLAGTLSSRLLDQLSLTPGEEFDHAAEDRKQILKKYRTVPTPAGVARVWGKLLEALPAHLKPGEFDFTVTVLDAGKLRAFTAGGGYVYVTRPLVEELLAGGRRGEAALAFTLAHELGHIARQHCRHGWQLLEMQEEIRQGIRTRLDPGHLRQILETGIETTGAVVSFLYSRAQTTDADLFALHLCRNAGVAQDEALDALRYLALLRHPQLRTGEVVPATAGALGDYLWAVPDPLLRLRRLQMERHGLVGDEKKYGLFVYDPESGYLSRCDGRTVAAGEPSVVFVHGMRGHKEDFRAYLSFLGGRKELAGRRLLVFRYPNDDSLARGGEFLNNEMKRVVAAPEKAFFVAHSAGGLIFRYYAEVKKGGFDRAVLLSTPHRGSSLADLKFLVELVNLDHDLRTGLPGGLERALPEGNGQLLYDVQPDSLFLRYLGHDPALAARYHVFSGRCLGPGAAMAVRLGVRVGCRALERRAAPTVRSPLLRREFLRRLEGFRAPEEITRGDLVVAERSSILADAGEVTRTHLTHNAFKTDEGVIRLVFESVVGK
jgi:Zn-dependent protease with chaperone function/pimeloyl-ACP methyl ester carboxylesterase